MTRAFELAHPLSLDGLTLVGELGAGATSDVFEVRLGDATAALKVAKHSRGAEEHAREARVLLRGSGPFLPYPLGVGWVRLERGRTVSVERGAPEARPALLLTRALRIAETLSLALAGLHTGGIAHGDVKPANVLVTTDGRATLVDFGFATEAGRRELGSGTPRYIARGDTDLGDARSRDLFAFALVLAELALPQLASVEDLAAAARRARLPSPFDEICAALLAETPEIRASASWAAERARSARSALAFGDGGNGDGGAALDIEQSARLAAVRNTYVRLQASVLRTNGEVNARSDEAMPWLDALAAWGRDLTHFEGTTGVAGEPTASPLGTDALTRWIAGVVGAASLGWPLGSIARAGEARVGRGLVALARQRSASTWTLRDVREAIEVGTTDAERPSSREFDRPAHDGASIARLALDLARAPAPERALSRVEGDVDTPKELVVQAARALRLRGEVGRARALARRLESTETASWIAAVAELYRRSGDRDAAARLAERALETSARSATVDATALACSARLLLDRGDAQGAIDKLGTPTDVLGLEVLALARAHAADLEGALRALDEAEGLPMDAEERARLLGARGYVLASSDPAAAYASFRGAAEHAAAASALLEEATYATGAGASGVDEGHLEEAAHASERAARIWEHLGHGPRAARATLNAASAYATAGRRAEAIALASRALELADLAADLRASAYARCVLADLEEPGSDRGRAHATEAIHLVGRDDAEALRVRARGLRHGLLEEREIIELDDLAL
ncbi:MAG: phosphotransferase, partial [Polyangiaceae bacterium]|nr:phosphotransferase [Polyangiaceae bacterium]